MGGLMQHPKEEQTLVLIKPDGVRRGLIGEIITCIEQRGLKVVGLQLIWASREEMDNHYPKALSWIKRLGEKTLGAYQQYKLDPIKELGTDDPTKIGQTVRNWIIDFMVSGPIVKMVVQGVHAIDMMRKLCGNTLPFKAEMGTIRGDYSVDSPAAANKDHRAVHNIVHASETPEEAQHEIPHWFSKKEIHAYTRSDEEIML
jgi:nucleoside-diphosphate kinase